MELYVISDGLKSIYLDFEDYIKYNINLPFIIAYKVALIHEFHGESNVLMFTNLKTGEVRFLSKCEDHHLRYKESNVASIWVQEDGCIDKFYEELDKLNRLEYSKRL